MRWLSLLSTLFCLEFGRSQEAYNEAMHLKCQALPMATYFCRKTLACYVRSDSRCTDIRFPAQVQSLDTNNQKLQNMLLATGVLKKGETLNSAKAYICNFKTPGDCGDYTQSGSACYKIAAASDTWGAAWTNCINEGGILFTPHSDDDVQRVAGLTYDSSTVGVFLGLKLISGQWSATDNKNTDYFRWTPKPYDQNYENELVSVLNVNYDSAGASLVTYQVISKKTAKLRGLCSKPLNNQYSPDIVPAPSKNPPGEPDETFTFRDKYLKEDNQVFAMNQPIYQQHRYALRSAHLQWWSMRNFGYLQKSVGYFIGVDQSNAFNECPKMVKKQLWWRQTKGTVEITDIGNPGSLSGSDWRDMGSFYCAAEKGYCEASLPLSLIKSKATQKGSGIVDYLWVSDPTEQDQALRNSSYSTTVDRTECYLWAQRPAKPVQPTQPPQTSEFRRRFINDANQLFRTYHTIEKFSMYCLREEHCQWYTLRNFARHKLPVGFVVNGQQGLDAAQMCPRLVRMKMWWRITPKTNQITEIGKDEKRDSNNWRDMGVFYCSPEQGYCEANTPLYRVKAKQVQQDNLYTNNAGEVGGEYENNTDGVVCYVW